ncbi:MAG TPA: HyaD/HybD family hydrogenase maturation endopeptidase [Gemmatimonadaceae bacterium]|nr:HyaD/HybD family hydrogenase maturation endopeptidase [Gemmatimonadaceae bacterium]
MPNDASRTVVLGLGNMLMTDDGIGLAALARLQDEWFIPRRVELVDGGTWGMNLLPIIESTDRLLVLDAIDSGAEPGTLSVLRDGDVPRVLAQKLSPHQIDLREVLALAALRGTLPDELVAIGVQPDVVEMGTDLSPAVEARLGELVSLAAAQLRAWDVDCFPVCVHA